MKRIGHRILRIMDRFPLAVPFGLVVVVVIGFSGTPALAVALAILVVLLTHFIRGWTA